MKRSSLRLALFGLLASYVASPALALTPSCQADLDKHAQSRLSVVERINKWGKKKPSAQQACSAFGDLVKVEGDMLKWMEDNMAWCQLPDALVEDFKKTAAQGVKVRGQACTAAKREAQMRAQQQQGGGQRGPAVGGGVQLPKGAL